jgi:hypothetical protein
VPVVLHRYPDACYSCAPGTRSLAKRRARRYKPYTTFLPLLPVTTSCRVFRTFKNSVNAGGAVEARGSDGERWRAHAQRKQHDCCLLLLVASRDRGPPADVSYSLAICDGRRQRAACDGGPQSRRS